MDQFSPGTAKRMMITSITHASIVAEDMMILNSGRFRRILRKI
jgi:hypothetical protein